MHRKRLQRLSLIVLILAVLACSIGLVLYALRQNISLFYSPSQVAANEVPKGDVFRIGGLVVDGSLHRKPGNLMVSFAVTDNNKQVTVNYNGILPDLFREGQGIVAQGRLNERGEFVADQVLAKHDENYMPREVYQTLRDNARDSARNTAQGSVQKNVSNIKNTNKIKNTRKPLS